MDVGVEKKCYIRTADVFRTEQWPRTRSVLELVQRAEVVVTILVPLVGERRRGDSRFAPDHDMS